MPSKIQSLRSRYKAKQNKSRPKPATPSDITALVAQADEFLAGKQFWQWGRAIQFLHQRDPVPARSALLKALDAPDPKEVAQCIIYEVQFDEYKAKLLSLLSSEDDAVISRAITVLAYWKDPELIPMIEPFLTRPIDGPFDKSPAKAAAGALAHLGPHPSHIQTIADLFESKKEFELLSLFRQFNNVSSLKQPLREAARRFYPAAIQRGYQPDPLSLVRHLTAEDLPLLREIHTTFKSDEALEKIIEYGPPDFDAVAQLIESVPDYKVVGPLARCFKGTNDPAVVDYFIKNKVSAIEITRVIGKRLNPLDTPYFNNDSYLHDLLAHLDPTQDIADEFWRDAVEIGLANPADHPKYLQEIASDSHPIKAITAVYSLAYSRHDDAPPPGVKAISGSFDSDHTPPPHDTLIECLGKISQGIFTPECVVQGKVKGGRAADPGTSTVEFIYNDLHHAFIPEFWGDHFDSNACILFANQALENAGHPERFFSLFAENFWVLFAHPDAFNKFASKWGFKDKTYTPANRDYPYQLVRSEDSFEWTYAKK